MSPILVAATTALLLACLHLSISAERVSVPEYVKSTTDRTGTEAFRSISVARQYLERLKQPETTCGIHLACPLNVTKCRTPVNIARNLNHLMYMYSSILGCPGNGDEGEETQLDFMEMTFFRFSSQMDRYIQSKKYTMYQSINKTRIQESVNVLSARCTRRDLIYEVIKYFQELARTTVNLDAFEQTSAFGYMFCDSVKKLSCYN